MNTETKLAHLLRKYTRTTSQDTAPKHALASIRIAASALDDATLTIDATGQRNHLITHQLAVARNALDTIASILQIDAASPP